MFITKGIIVDAGAALIQDPLYDDKVKIRIPELHGFGDLVKEFQEASYTLDEDLPWCKITVNAVNTETKYPILQYKAQTYAPADIVYVSIDSDSPATNYLITGLYEKYNENSDSDTSLTTYNNIDVSTILANKVDFPPELIDPSKGSSDSIDSGSGESAASGPWMQIVSDCKKAMSQQAGYYSQSTTKKFEVDGSSYKARLDCSGFTSLCLIVAGVYPAGKMDVSGNFLDTNKTLKSAGWQHYNWSGYNKLQSGDIIAKNGHVEIFSRNADDKHYVYSYGNDNQAANPGENTDRNNYTSVWRPPSSLIDGGGDAGTSQTTVSNSTNYKTIFGYPFKNKQTVSCKFGKPGSWKAGKHTGIDLSGPTGTPIYAVGDGIVEVAVSGNKSYGNYVIIKHGDVNGEKLWTLYAHMDKKPLVKVGDAVKGTQLVNGSPQKGTQLGVRGNTGNSHGAHLHFEFRKGTNSYYSYTDPNKYISF